MYIFLKRIGIVLTLLVFSHPIVVPAEPYKVRIASHGESPLYEQAQLFIEAINSRRPGEFAFTIYPRGELGLEQALIADLRAGSLEMAILGSGVLRLDGKLGLFDLPWLFDDRLHVMCALSGELGRAVAARIESQAQIVVLGIYETGFRHILNAKRPITVPADLQGLKIRVAGGKFRERVFQSMGAEPQWIEWGETRDALVNRTVDGAESIVAAFYDQTLFKLADYLSLTGHVYTPSFLLASSAFFADLRPEQQQAFREAGQAITQRAYSVAATVAAKNFTEMKKWLTINRANVKAFQKATRDVYGDYIAHYGLDWLTLVEEAHCPKLQIQGRPTLFPLN